jgi:hypothetical protein
MSAADILTHLSAAGISLTPTPTPGLIFASPRAALTDEHRRLIRAHKPELLALLTQAPAPVPPLTPDDKAAIAEALEERAAIREHEGGEPRPVAEREAREAMRVYRVLVAMGEGQPPRWVALLAPGCDPAEAERLARWQFGAARVLELIEHRGGIA